MKKGKNLISQKSSDSIKYLANKLSAKYMISSLSYRRDYPITWQLHLPELASSSYKKETVVIPVVFACLAAMLLSCGRRTTLALPLAL
jgi:hypothetical protein